MEETNPAELHHTAYTDTRPVSLVTPTDGLTAETTPPVPSEGNKRLKQPPGLGIVAFVFSLIVVILAVIQWVVLKTVGFGTLFSFLNVEGLLAGQWETMGDTLDLALARLVEVLVLYFTLVGIQWLIALMGTIFAIIALVKNRGFWWAIISIGLGIAGIGLAAILSGVFGLI